MKLIIAGGRDFNLPTLMKEELNKLVDGAEDLEIVSGMARGADKLGYKLAKANNVPVKTFIPDWDGLGKRAGFVRNAEMGDYATHLIAFHDSHSKGTLHMIQYMLDLGKHVTVISYEGEDISENYRFNRNEVR